MGKLISINSLHVVNRPLNIQDNNFLDILNQSVVIDHLFLEGSVISCVCPQI